MSGIRFLKGLTCGKGEEPLVYLYFKGEGWFLLRQLIQLFFPEQTEESLHLTMWCAKHIQSSRYHNTALKTCRTMQLRNPIVVHMLRHACIPTSTYIVDLPSTQTVLQVLDPPIRASILIAFHDILSELLRKGGRKRAVTDKERMQIAAEQKWKCKSCQTPFGSDLNFEIDHIFAWSKGGSNRRINLQALCSLCHTQKTRQESRSNIFQDIRHS